MVKNYIDFLGIHVPKIDGVKEGLHQYYEIEQTTDLWAFNTGRVQEKMGVNDKELPAKTPVSFVLLDNHHLTEYGCERLTVQSGGTVNGLFLREKLFDYVDVVMAPVLIGGREISTLIDGKSLTADNELSGLGAFKR